MDIKIKTYKYKRESAQIPHGYKALKSAAIMPPCCLILKVSQVTYKNNIFVYLIFYIKMTNTTRTFTEAA